jgi:hypothetical protein
MKALSLTQPWAWLVSEGHKDIENRTWNTSFRGRFLIHASKKMTAADYDTAYGVATGYDVDFRIPYRDRLQYGGIVGTATLVDVIPPGASGRKWHFHDQWGFVLKDMAPLPFTPCKGALGFWEVPFEIEERIAIAVAS